MKIFKSIHLSNWSLTDKLIKTNTNQLNLIKKVSTHQDATTFSIVKLTNRSILHVYGRDCLSFVQSLTTNNLQTKKHSIASLLVNDNGKILCDLIIHRLSGDPFDKELRLNGLTWKNYGKRFVDCSPSNELEQESVKDNEMVESFSSPEQLLIECDSKISEPLLQTFLGRKVREHVQIQHLHHLNVYAIYPNNFDYNQSNGFHSFKTPELVSERAIFTEDPRLQWLGYRFVSESNDISLIQKFVAMMLNIDERQLMKGNQATYRTHRYRVGVAEGLAEMGHARLFLLETNADYLNQVSLEKGHFSGDLPTGRVNDRNRLWKRMLPFQLISSSQSNRMSNDSLSISPNSAFFCDGRPVGRAICFQSNGFGLGIFNLKVLAPKIRKNVEKHNLDQMEMELTHAYSKQTVKIHIPRWWPELNKQAQPPMVLSNEPFINRLERSLQLIKNSNRLIS